MNRTSVVLSGIYISGLESAMNTQDQGQAQREWQSSILMALVATICISLATGKAFFAPITHDEAVTYGDFASLPYSQIFSAYHLPNNHIFNSLMIHFVTETFGVSPFAVRLPALIWGSIGLLSLLVFRRWFGVRLDIGVILIAALPAWIDYSSMARGYSIGCSLTILAVLFLGRILLGELSGGVGRYILIVLTGICLGLGIGSVPTFLFSGIGVVAGYVAGYLLCKSNKKIKTLVCDCLIIGGICFALTFLFYGKTGASPSSFRWGIESLSALNAAVWAELFRFDWVTPWLTMCFTVLLFLLFIAAMVSAVRRRDSFGVMLGVCTVVVLALSLMSSQLGQHLYPFARNLLVLVIIVFLLISNYVSVAFERYPGYELSSIAIFVVLIALLHWSIWDIERIGMCKNDAPMYQVIARVLDDNARVMKIYEKKGRQINSGEKVAVPVAVPWYLMPNLSFMSRFQYQKEISVANDWKSARYVLVPVEDNVPSEFKFRQIKMRNVSRYRLYRNLSWGTSS